MTANDTGSTSWKAQDGTPRAMGRPTSISIATTSTAERASRPVMPAATVAAKPCATCRAAPSGMNVAVASAISRLRRAAIAAPRKPTTSVKCSTNGIDPGMPPAKNGRTAISASGRSAITASAPAASHSSPAWSPATTGAARRLRPGSVFIILRPAAAAPAGVGDGPPGTGPASPTS